MKLFNGDCMDLLPTFGKDSVSLVLTDIPYGEVNRESGGLRSLNKGAADEMLFSLDPFVSELVRVCSGSFYVFCGIQQISHLTSLFEREGLSTRLGFWEKTNPSPMNGEHLWMSAVECCVFARKAKATFNEHCKAPIWRGGTCESKIHDTQKPVGLFQRLVKASSLPGDTVLDPCMGSGTTGIACHITGRDFVGIELNKKYFEAAEKRLMKDELQLRLLSL